MVDHMIMHQEHDLPRLPRPVATTLYHLAVYNLRLCPTGRTRWYLIPNQHREPPQTSFGDLCVCL